MKLLSIFIICLAVTAYADPQPWRILGGIRNTLGNVVGGVVGGVKDVVGGVVGGVDDALGGVLGNISDLGKDILSGALHIVYGVGRILYRGVQRILTFGRNIRPGCGSLSRTINGLRYGFSFLIEQTLKLVINILTVQRRCYTVVTNHSTQLIGSLNEVTVRCGRFDFKTLDILKSVTLSSTQLISQVTNLLGSVFVEIDVTLALIVRDLGSLSGNLSVLVKGIGTGVNELLLLITKLTTSVTTNGKLIVNACSVVTTSTRNLIAEVYKIAQAISKTAANAVLEALNSLAILLSFVIQVVLYVLVDVAEILRGISPVVQQVLESTVNALAFASRGAEQIYNSIINCFSNPNGIYVGLQLNINILLNSVGRLLFDFTENTSIISTVLGTLNQVTVDLGVKDIIGGFNGSLKYVFNVVNELLSDIEKVIGSVFTVRQTCINLGTTINDIVNQIVSLLGKVVTNGVVQNLVNAIDVLIEKLADQIEELVEVIKPLLTNAANDIQVAFDAIIRAVYQITSVISVGTNSFCDKIASENTVVTTSTSTTTNTSTTNTVVEADVEENMSFLFKDWKMSVESTLTTEEIQISHLEYETVKEYVYTVETIVVKE